MSVPIHIAAGTEGVFWIVIVVVSIIAQIVKAGRQNAGRGGPRPSPAPGLPADEPADELRQFLEKLAGAPTKERPATVPPPVPRVPQSSTRTRTAAPSRTMAAAMRHERARAAESRPAPDLEPAPVSVAAPAMPQPAAAMAPMRGLPAQPALIRANELRAVLHDPAGIRRAVLLREILGPPVALQRNSSYWVGAV